MLNISQSTSCSVFASEVKYECSTYSSVMSVDASGIERESSHVISSTLCYAEASIVCEEDGAILQESYSNTYIILEVGEWEHEDAGIKFQSAFKKSETYRQLIIKNQPTAPVAVGYGDSDGGGSDREHEDNGRQELSDRQYAGLPQEEKDSTVDFSIPILAQMVERLCIHDTYKPNCSGCEKKLSPKPRFYPTQDRLKKLKSRKNLKPAKLRKSLTPGTVVVLLAGRHRGERFAFLKQLQSGLLLVKVLGPYQVNRVPLRRVPQSYVIATHAKIDVGSLKVDKALNGDFFKRQKKKKKRGDDMFEQSVEGYQVSDVRKQKQKSQTMP